MKSKASCSITGFFSACLCAQTGLTYARYCFPRLSDDRSGLGYLIEIAQDVMRSFFVPIRPNDGIERSIDGR
jgi:hypothetical protein